MKIIFYLKNLFFEATKVFIVIITMMNGTIVFALDQTIPSVSESNLFHSIDQAINLLPDTTYSRSQLKNIPETFTEKSYSHETSLNNQYSHLKILNIITEAISELNSRNSSFLIVELTTST